jgi:pyridoxine kinase
MCLSEGRIGGAYAARHPGSFPGTGDLLASAAIGALLRGLPLEKALDLAVRFVSGSIAWHEEGQDSRLGVPFERQLPSLMRDVQQMLDEGVNNLNG